jgi:putative nucleotidyltransferase with HDIG domain
MVVDKASQVKHKSEYPLAFMWAALLHDIGKLTTTKIRKGRITSYNHDNEGEDISKEMLDKLTDDEELKYQISKLVRYHMQPLFFDKNLPVFISARTVSDAARYGIPCSLSLTKILEKIFPKNTLLLVSLMEIFSYGTLSRSFPSIMASLR